jgi:hypothetical protein
MDVGKQLPDKKEEICQHHAERRDSLTIVDINIRNRKE